MKMTTDSEWRTQDIRIHSLSCLGSANLKKKAAHKTKGHKKGIPHAQSLTSNEFIYSEDASTQQHTPTSTNHWKAKNGIRQLQHKFKSHEVPKTAAHRLLKQGRGYLRTEFLLSKFGTLLEMKLHFRQGKASHHSINQLKDSVLPHHREERIIYKNLSSTPPLLQESRISYFSASHSVERYLAAGSLDKNILCVEGKLASVQRM